jgi:cytochrome P450
MQQATDAFDRFSPANVQDPYELYARTRARPPFLDATLGMWIVARYGDVRTVLADHERFSSDFDIRSPQWPSPEVEQVLASGHPEVRVLLNEDPPAHTAVRTLVAGTFNPRRVRELTPSVRQLAGDLIDRFADAGHADLVGELAWPLPLQVICRLLGLPLADAEKIRSWIEALAELTSYSSGPAEQLAAAHESVAFEHYLAEFIADRRARPGDDLTSALVTATDPALTDTQLISLLITLIFGGHETTANLIGNTLLSLLSPAGADRSEPVDLAAVDIDAAVEETLRRDPSVQGMFRSTRTDVELGGVTIPAGSTVFALIAAANRDPDTFHDPGTFDVDRTGEQPHLAFGRGVHFCLGAPLARMEAREVITAVISRLPGLRLAPEFVPPYLPNLMHRGPRRLDVRWGNQLRPHPSPETDRAHGER